LVVHKQHPRVEIFPPLYKGGPVPPLTLGGIFHHNWELSIPSEMWNIPLTPWVLSTLYERWNLPLTHRKFPR